MTDTKITKDAVLEAVNILGTGEEASIEDIKTRYRELLSQWHPDICRNNRDRCKEMTRKITSAYEILMCYCVTRKFCFTEEEVSRETVLSDPEEFWKERFGHDRHWGAPE